MATDGPTPAPCDIEIFKNGKSIVMVTGSSNAVENWVRAVAKKADARLDWHYSGGIANILHLGDAESRTRAIEAMQALKSELKGTILRFVDVGANGLYREGVTPVPPGTVASFYTGGQESTFVVDPNKQNT